MFEDDDDLQPGERLGRFELQRLLGKGGMGEVFLANDTLLDVPVALKVLDPDLATSEGFERFRREVLLARQVTHPGICRIFDLHEEKGHFFISMEYIEGPTLQMVLRDSGLLPPAVAVELVRALCRAVSAAHQLDIIHRDLKPGNIIVRGRDRVSILDFGLSKAAHMSSITVPGVTIGTVTYMPPEAIGGEPATMLSDIYSIGVILYESVTGRLPFEGSNVIDLQRAIVTGRVVPPSRFIPGISPELEAAILIALALEPERRFDTIDAFELALGEVGDLVGANAPISAESPALKSGRATVRLGPLDSSERTEAHPALAPLDSDHRTEVHLAMEPIESGQPSETPPDFDIENAVTMPEAVPVQSTKPTDPILPRVERAPARQQRSSFALAAASITVGIAAGLVALYAVFGNGSGQVSAAGGIDASAPTGSDATVAIMGAATDSGVAVDSPTARDAGRPAGADAATRAAPSADATAPTPRAAPTPAQRVERLRRAFIELRRKKGIIVGDCERCDRGFRDLRGAKAMGQLDIAEQAGERALAALNQVEIDKDFVDRKLQRFNLRFDKVDSVEAQAEVTTLAQQSIEAIDRGDFTAANRLLNRAFQQLNTP